MADRDGRMEGDSRMERNIENPKNKDYKKVTIFKKKSGERMERHSFLKKE